MTSSFVKFEKQQNSWTSRPWVWLHLYQTKHILIRHNTDHKHIREIGEWDITLFKYLPLHTIEEFSSHCIRSHRCGILIILDINTLSFVKDGRTYRGFWMASNTREQTLTFSHFIATVQENVISIS